MTVVDPIFWQGFPAVDEQEVFVRLIFDEQGTGAGVCSGEASPGGLLCRETLGLVRRDELANLDEWRIARSGLFGHWDHYPDRGHVDGSGGEVAGEDAAGFQHGGGEQPNALLVWEGAGVLPVGHYFQVAHKIAGAVGWWNLGWGGIAFGMESDGEHYTVELPHRCGLLSTVDYIALYNRLAVGLLAAIRGQHATKSYKYIKAGIPEQGTVQTFQAYTSRRGQQTFIRSNSAYGAGKVGLVVNACSQDNDSTLVLFSKPTHCSGNRVQVKNLPAGWQLEIDTSTAGTERLSVTGTGTGDVYINFGAAAWPYETFYLYDGDRNLLESWTPTVNPGIWGGDVINLDPGGVGVGKIGGAAARLSGTPGGGPGSGYFAYLDDGSQLVLAKGDEESGLVTLGTFAYSHGPGVYYNIHLSAVGTAIKAKVWNDTDGEPGAFQIEETDSDYASGAPGMVALDDTVVDFDVFAAGIGGDPYPTGRNPGTPVWLTPEVPHTVPASDPVLHLSWTRPPMTNDVLGGVVRYELEFQQNGVSGWTPLALVTDQEFYDWDTTNLPAFPDYCVRVRAVVGCEFGPWAPLCGIGIEGIPAEKESPDGYFFGDWYTGEPDLGKWIRKFQESHLDDDLPVEACWVTREFMPVGVGGEAVFQAAYLAFTVTTTTRFQVTPILDGDRLDTETREFVAAPSGRWLNERREIDFSKPYDRDNVERFRGGLRGSCLQLEICATDIGGTGRAEVDGVAVAWSKARETHPWARPFAGELETDVVLEHLSRFYFGTDTADGFEAAIYQLGGSFDFGQRLRIHIEPRPWAPAGPNGEVTATDLYICVTRSNEGAAAIDVTPIVDGDELETTTIQLAGTSQPLTEVLEIPLSVPYSRDDTERLRTGARGTWFSFRLTNSGDRPDGEFIVNGAALNMSKARESARDVGLEDLTPELE